MLRIIKRDGRIVEFDKTKIKSAVQKAYVGEDTDKVELSEMIANDVVNRIRSMIKDDDKVYDIDIEDIQDAVEVALMKKHPETAKRYILYRENRSKIRNNKSTINRKIDELIQCSAEESDTKRENANIDGNTTCGSLLQIAGTVSKEYYFNHVSDPKFKMYHDQGVIHLHDSDLSLFTINCLYIPLAKLLKNGFSTGHVYLSTPSNVISAAELTCVIIQSNQNDMFGGQAIANLDYDLAPYVAKSFVRNCAEYLNATLFVSHDWAYTILKEQFVAPLDEYIAKKERIINNEGTTLIKKYFELIVATYHKEKLVDDDFFSNMYNYATFKTEKDTHQGMQALVCNLNSLQSRAGSQTPFSSVNLGLDTSEEGRMITKHLFEITEQGTALNEIFIFPISIFKIHKDTCYPGCKNYDLFKLACKTSAKAEYPNFVNVSAPMNVKYYDPARPETSVASMGCRTRVLGNAYDPDNAVTSGRGNLFFNTINLPYLALLAKETYPDNEKERYDYFNTLLDEKVHELIKFSHDRFELAARRKAKNFPFLMCQHVYLGSEQLLPDDEIREVIKNGSMAIGFIGLAETLVALFGKHHGESEESQKKGIEIISRMKAITDDYSKKEKMNYSIIATPAEGCSGRLLRATRKRFGTVKGVTDREYFTNSVHVPVWFKISAYDKIRLEAPYHPLCEGGIISYIELDYDATKNLEAFESLVLAMAESGMTYFSINHPVDHDPICGYTGYIPIDGRCPRCGRKSEEGVPAGKLLSLRSYNPTPEYAVHYSELEEKDKTTNSINLI